MKKFLLATGLLLTGHMAFSQTTEVSFDEEFYTVKEGTASINLSVSLDAATTSDITVDVALVSGIGNVTPTYTTQTLTFLANGSTTQSINIAISDDNIANNDGFFAVELVNINGAQEGDTPKSVVM